MKAKREKSPPEAVVANTEIKQEIYELAHEELSAQAETDAEIAPLIQKVGATSIAEIDRLLAELEEAKNYLQSEGKRIELEMARYSNLARMTSLTAKIISDAVSKWHPARNQQKSNASEVTAASTEDDIGVRTSGPPEGSSFSI
jgi:SOS-response transcriptional repressor LexA